MSHRMLMWIMATFLSTFKKEKKTTETQENKMTTAKLEKIYLFLYFEDSKLKIFSACGSVHNYIRFSASPKPSSSTMTFGRLGSAVHGKDLSLYSPTFT